MRVDAFGGMMMSSGLNMLLITTDEERFQIPRPPGFSLPGRDRVVESGVTFARYYAASTQCSSARSVMYTGRHVPITQIYDNDTLPHIRPLDPGLGTIGTMLRTQGYYCAYQGKWHLSNAYVDPTNPVSTVDALEPYGFPSSTNGATSTAGPGLDFGWTQSWPDRRLSGCAIALRRSEQNGRGSWR
jgi:arylsulfatase A-like enzyme